MADETVIINPDLLSVAKEVFSTLSEQRAEHSFSFLLTEDGFNSISDTIKVVEWGIGGNKSKLKATALEILEEFATVDQGVPINVNLTEYELKSMEEVALALEKAEESHQDGELT
jgi:hypothetical protein